MTHIVNLRKYPTKKSLREAVEAGKDPYLEDPSLFSPFSGRISAVVSEKGSVTITNHPKRSWFAEARMVNGKVKVS